MTKHWNLKDWTKDIFTQFITQFMTLTFQSNSASLIDIAKITIHFCTTWQFKKIRKGTGGWKLQFTFQGQFKCTQKIWVILFTCNILKPWIWFFVPISDRPEIEQEETFIHTREGGQTEVICVVHSSPRANVSWFKNGAPLDTRANQINQIGNRHTLSLPITGRDSFGEYTCRASNPYGTSQKTTEVSGNKKELQQSQQ